MRLSKIFVGGEQINYLLKPKAEANNNWSARLTDKSRYFVITEFNNCFIIHRVCFLRNIFGKRSDLPFLRKSDRKKEKSVVSVMHEQNIINFAAKNSWTTLRMSTPLFLGSYLIAGHVVGSRPMKRKENLHLMINTFFGSSPSPTLSLLYYKILFCLYF